MPAHDPKPTSDPTPDTTHETTAENIVSHRRTTAGNPIPTDANNAPDHPVVQPLGQATSADSDADSKAALNPDAEEANPAPDVETARVSWTLPKSTVDAVKAHADANDMSLSEAADALLTTSTGYVSATRLNY